MIEATILFLTVSDCNDSPIVKKWNIDARVNHNFEISTIGPLKQTFSRVIIYDYLEKYVKFGVNKTNREIIDIVHNERPDYMLWPSMNYEILESTFDKIRGIGSQVLGWFFDDEIRFDNYSKWWIPHLDYILTTDVESVRKYKIRGAKAIHFLVYSNPDIFRRLNLPKRYNVSLVGSKIADREELVSALRQKGVAIEAFGRGWGSGYISIEQMIEIYNVSRINLCLLKSYGVNTRPQFKCKIFDICLCGGFLLCEYIPGIENYYEIGKEIVCFYNLEDAQQKIRYYLENEKERRQIAESGYRRAIRDYAAQNRLALLFKTVRQWNTNGSDEEKPPKSNKPGYRQLQTPLSIRKKQSEFHLRWARALMSENGKSSRWSDEMLLARSYCPFNIEVWWHRLIGYLPLSIREKIITAPEICKIILKKILNFKRVINE